MSKHRDDHAARPVAFVTGSSSGFGLLTSVSLARSGYIVMATMRDTDKRHELLRQASAHGVSESVRVLEMDVTDHRAVLEAVSSVIEQYGAIDVLVNNAGFAVGGVVEEIEMDAWRSQVETNVFGLIAVTKAVLPSMRERGKGLIVNIGSISGRIGFPGYAPYAASKFAVEGFSEALRLEMLPFGVHVVLIEPGAYNTAIWEKGFDQIRSRPDSPYRPVLQAVLRYSRKAASEASDPQEVADLVVRLAKDPAPRLRYALGKGNRISLLGKTLLPWKWFERIVMNMLKSLSK